MSYAHINVTYTLTLYIMECVRTEVAPSAGDGIVHFA